MMDGQPLDSPIQTHESGLVSDKVRAASTSEPTCVPDASLCMVMEVLSVLLYIKAEVGGMVTIKPTRNSNLYARLGVHALDTSTW